MGSETDTFGFPRRIRSTITIDDVAIVEAHMNNPKTHVLVGSVIPFRALYEGVTTLGGSDSHLCVVIGLGQLTHQSWHKGVSSLPSVWLCPDIRFFKVVSEPLILLVSWKRGFRLWSRNKFYESDFCTSCFTAGLHYGPWSCPMRSKSVDWLLNSSRDNFGLH